VNDFGSVGEAYRDHCTSVRGRLRHDIVFRDLNAHLDNEASVLDVGCGDGEMSLRLARAGHIVVGIDPSSAMLQAARQRLEQEPTDIAGRVTFAQGDLFALRLKGDFDCVCCHGVLMYLSESRAALTELARWTRPGGVLSVLAKNAVSVGFREALKRDYLTAQKIISSTSTLTSGNLGIETRGDYPDDLVDGFEGLGFKNASWSGVRIFSDHYHENERMTEEDYCNLLSLEEAASTKDPYRQMARLVHVLGRKVSS
jgi:S-adenosylmethionine-dependent methyltransferase